MEKKPQLIEDHNIISCINVFNSDMLSCVMLHEITNQSKSFHPDYI